jgi:ABC-type multidrug transport system permease subunit
MSETPVQTTGERSGRSVWALVCGVIAVIGVVPFVPVIEYLFAPAAIVLGAFGLRDAGNGMRGRGLALSGMVLGAAALLVALARYFASF